MSNIFNFNEIIFHKKNSQIIPLTLRMANDFIASFHRHCKPVRCHRFSLGLLYNGMLIGVIVVNDPIARALVDGFTLEITRCCILDGYKNANSYLYARIKKIALLMGFKKLITYTLVEESGSTLKAIKAKNEYLTGGKQWSNKNRKRDYNELYNKKKYFWNLIQGSD